MWLELFSCGSNQEALILEATELDTPDIEALQEKSRRYVLKWLKRHGYIDPDTVRA